MSLINEALRKARKEAAGARSSQARQQAPMRRNERHTPWAAILVIALLAALFGGSISWWFFRGKSEPSAPGSGAKIETATIQATPPAEAPPSSDEPLPVENTKPATPPAQGTSPGKTQSRPIVSPTPSPSPTPTPPQSKPTPIPEKTVFTATARIDGAVLNLDYLVFRKDQPFAEINGVTVGEGGMIEGFKVEKISEDRIILQHDGKTYTILVSS